MAVRGPHKPRKTQVRGPGRGMHKGLAQQCKREHDSADSGEMPQKCVRPVGTRCGQDGPSPKDTPGGRANKVAETPQTEPLANRMAATTREQPRARPPGP